MPQRVVFDDISAMDGLERLVVVCVGLDQAKGDAAAQRAWRQASSYRFVANEMALPPQVITLTLP